MDTPPKPTIVFDLDGTLADTADDLLTALNRTLDRCGVPPFVKRDFERLSGGGGLRGMLAYAFETHGDPLSEARHHALFAETVKDYDHNIAVKSRLYPGVSEALDAFDGAGWVCAVCTNKPLAQATRLLDALGIKDRFSGVTGCDSFAFRKPDPRHLLRTIELANGARQCAVMVGDSETDILTAKHADIPVIAVDFGYSEQHVTAYGPDSVISDYANIFREADDLIGRF